MDEEDLHVLELGIQLVGPATVTRESQAGHTPRDLALDLHVLWIDVHKTWCIGQNQLAAFGKQTL